MTSAIETSTASLSTLVFQFRKNADQIAHLAAVTSQEFCDLDTCRQCNTTNKEGFERIHMFTDLVEKLAKEISEIAEQIEVADFESRHPLAA